MGFQATPGCWRHVSLDEALKAGRATAAQAARGRRSLDDGEPPDKKAPAESTLAATPADDGLPLSPAAPHLPTHSRARCTTPSCQLIESTDSGRLPMSSDDGEARSTSGPTNFLPPRALLTGYSPTFKWVPGGLDGLEQRWEGSGGLARRNSGASCPSLLGNVGGLSFISLASLHPDRRTAQLAVCVPPAAEFGLSGASASEYWPSESVARHCHG